MRYYLFILVATLFLACSESPVIEKTFSVDGNSWDYDDIFETSIEVVDSSKTYRLVLEVDHSDEFAFQNVYAKVSTTLPSGKKVEDPISLQLSDKYGRWYGKCGSGKCKANIIIREGFKFQHLGSYDFKIEQLSREDKLEGVSGLALKLFEIKKS